MRNWLIVTVGLAALGCNDGRLPEKKEQAYDLMIAYNVLLNEEKDDYEVFIMNADGSEKRNLSNHSGVDWVYHAYEDKVYFISDRDTAYRNYFLYEIDVNGENLRKVCPFRLEDSWLSSRNNGKEFVVSGMKDGLRHTLYIVDNQGNIVRQLTRDTSQYFNDPQFSPDGKEIAYRYRKNPRDRNVPDEIWIMDEFGNNRRQLTQYPENDTTAEWHAYHAGPPVWEPNQNIISFASKRNGNYSLYTIKPDGKNLQQITEGGFNELWHDWSPDGEQLVYDGWDTEERKYSIFNRNANGGEVQQLTNEYKYEQAPVFVKRFRKE